MNTNKLIKHVKRKVVNNFTMGQKISSASKSQCSIFSVDEDVQIVINNDEDTKYPAISMDNSNIELSRRSYSKKNPITYPNTDPGPFDITVLSGMTGSLKSYVKPKQQIKRKYNGKLESPSEKIVKRETSLKCRSPTISFTRKDSKQNEFIVNEISSGEDIDSDVELIEEVIVNPISLNHKCMSNLSSRRPIQNQSFTNNNKRLSDARRRDIKPVFHQVPKSCFISEKSIMNEADTAPFMPSSLNSFPDIRSGSSPIKWQGMNESMALEKSNNIRKKTSPRNMIIKSELTPDVKEAQSDKASKSRELRNLYANLNEIAWTQENSFKKLLRNPDYIRHSERGSRISGSNKTLRNIALKKNNNNKVRTLKKSPTLQASLKKSKLAKANTNKRLASGNSNKLKLSATEVLSELSKNNKTCSLNVNAKVKSSVSNLKAKAKLAANFEKPVLQRNNNKKPVVLIDGKIHKSKEKLAAFKLKNELKSKDVDALKDKTQVKPKLDMDTLKDKTQVKPKLEVCEASGSSLQNGSFDTAYSNFISYNKNGNMKKFNHQESLDAKQFDLLQDFKGDTKFSAIKKAAECKVRLENLYQPNSFSDSSLLTFTNFDKQFLQKTFRKAMEKRDPHPTIHAMLQTVVDAYTLDKALEDKVKRKKPEEESVRASIRQLELIFRYKEIVVKKHPNYWQVVLVPNSSKKNCLSIEAIRELREAFQMAKKEPKCCGVLLNSGGSYFCSGIDLSQLIGTNKKAACEEMASVIRELVLVLGSFSKPIVAAVNGDALGFGVSLLTYCDVVLASDKANFCIPSSTIGYMPEGGLTLTLPQVMGITRSSEMLLQGTRITASQAQQKGLVTGVFWPTNFMHEVIPRVEAIISQPVQVMEATKLLLRSNVWDKLRTHMDYERQLLVSQWLTPSCQENIKRILRGDTQLI